jgi:hypothetical protein
MKKYSTKIIVYSIILLIFAIIFTGCESVIPEPPSEMEQPIPPPVRPSSGWVIIENDIDTIQDCTPFLSIYSEGAAYMSFSGNGENWTEWIDYSTSYEEFNIASGLNGTEFNAGLKYIYVHFKDEEGNLSSPDVLAFDTVEFEFGELFSIKIFPDEVTISIGESYLFTLHGYDLKLNEVPLVSAKVTWTKCCGVGDLSPTIGLSTTYTAPSSPGERDISAHYENLNTAANVIVVRSK